MERPLTRFHRALAADFIAYSLTLRDCRFWWGLVADWTEQGAAGLAREMWDFVYRQQRPQVAIVACDIALEPGKEPPCTPKKS